ncbi:MAG TPA: hypothetical protein V6C69_13300 [Trichormus sp.]
MTRFDTKYDGTQSAEKKTLAAEARVISAFQRLVFFCKGAQQSIELARDQAF